jgi:hypothetical protein
MNIDLGSLLLKNIDDFVVYREKYHIDILLISVNAKQLIAIENKVGAKQGRDQLKVYKEKLDDEYRDYEKLLLFLTPTDEEPDDEGWLKISYRSVLYACERMFRHKDIKDKTHMLLSNYIDILKRNVMNENDEIEKLCMEIYKKHKSALDLIFENRPDISSRIFERVSTILAERSNEKKDVIFDPKGSVKSYIRFTTKTLEELVPRCEPVKENGWGDGYMLKYEIVNVPSYEKIYFQAQTTAQTENDEPFRQRIIGIVQEYKKEFGLTRVKFGGKWTAVYYKTMMDKKDFEADPEAMNEALNKAMARVLDHDIKRLESVLSEHLLKI